MEEINQTGDYASAGQIKAGFIGDRCQPSLSAVRTMCVSGKEEVGFPLTFRAGRSTDPPSHVVFKPSELLVCLSQRRKLQQAAAKSRLPGAGGQMAAEAQSGMRLREELQDTRTWL